MARPYHVVENLDGTKLVAVKDIPPTQLRKAKLAVANMVAFGHTLPNIAKALETNVDTIRDWLREPFVQEELENTQREAMQAIRGKLLLHATKAEQTLFDLLSDASPSIRHKAAESLLKHAMPKLDEKQEHEDEAPPKIIEIKSSNVIVDTRGEAMTAKTSKGKRLLKDPDQPEINEPDIVIDTVPAPQIEVIDV